MLILCIADVERDVGMKNLSQKEAITLLRNLEDSLDSYCELNEEGKTAFGMAITALELFGNSEQLPSVQPDTTTYDSIPAETGKNDGDGTSSDCISRRASLEKIRTMQTYKLFAGDDMLLIDQAEAQTELMMLPSVQPEHKTGRWLPDNTDYYRTKFICSVCGESEEVPTTGFGYGAMWDYCPMCGAKMERRQDGH